MVTITGEFLIELRSDICAASGFSFAGVVDNDVSCNRNGIPLISGRRLKGCMKEAAKQLQLYGGDKYKFDDIFGSAGDSDYDDNAIRLHIGDAYPQGWSEINEEIDNLKSAGADMNQYLTRESILNMFTTVRAQTSIEDNGISDDNSLRFTRIVNMTSPIHQGKLVFCAPISIVCSDDVKESVITKIENIAKATRHIGSSRNRGLGNVRMQFKVTSNDNTAECNDETSLDRSQKVRIDYRMMNDYPIMLSGSSDMISEDYIPGTSVLGAFVKEYLKQGTADSEEFVNLFLDGSTLFSNMYLCKEWKYTGAYKDKSVWVSYYPVPLYINMLKITKRLVNVAVSKPTDGLANEYKDDNGNFPRRIKTGLLGEYDNQYDVKEIKKEIIYHYSKENKKESGDGTLYYQEVIEAGQFFSGYIITEKKNIDIILKILNKQTFYFGKSKSAQYGKCCLKKIKVSNYGHNSELSKKGLLIKKGDLLMVTLMSDGIFVGEEGQYTINRSEVRKIIANSMGFDNDNPLSENIIDSYVITKEITGYSGIWNLKKQAIPAVKAGSSYVIQADKDIELSDLPTFIGVKNNEGFGQCKIMKINDSQNFCYVLKEKGKDEKHDKGKLECSENIKKILKTLILKNIDIEIGNRALNKNTNRINISASALGRVTLMLEDAENSVCRTENVVYYKKVWNDFVHRVLSIKSKKTERTIEELFEMTFGYFGDLKYDDTDTVKKIGEHMNVKGYEDLCLLCGDKEASESVFSLWTNYMHRIFACEKYWKKGDL